jgi:hypothetical protein
MEGYLALRLTQPDSGPAVLRADAECGWLIQPDSVPAVLRADAECE